MNPPAGLGVWMPVDDNLEALPNMRLRHHREVLPGQHQQHQQQCRTTSRRLKESLTCANHYLPQTTRQPETALRRGGLVAPVGPIPTAMLLRYAGECDGTSHHTIPAVTMNDAWAPSTHPAPRKSLRCSGVKNATPGNRPARASHSPEGVIIEGETCRRKQDPAQSVAPRPQGQRDTLEPKWQGSRNPGNRADTAPEVRNDLWFISGNPGGMPHFLTGRNKTAMERGNRRALSTRKGRAGLWPHARGGQVGHQANVRGHARNMPNCP